MKRILFLLALTVSVTLSVNAQRFTALPTVAGDTISTSTSKDTVFKYVSATAGYNTAAFKIKYTKISGTVALKAYLYGGDGTDYETSPSDSTAAFSNASGYVYITKTAVPYSHYMIQVRGADGSNSTQAVKIEISHLLKKHN